MRSCRNPEKLDSRTGAIFTVHDATSKLGILSRAVMVAVTFFFFLLNLSNPTHYNSQGGEHIQEKRYIITVK